MPHYKFTEHAERDLDAIVEHTLENWGQSQAVKYVDGLDVRRQLPCPVGDNYLDRLTDM